MFIEIDEALLKAREEASETSSGSIALFELSTWCCECYSRSVLREVKEREQSFRKVELRKNESLFQSYKLRDLPYPYE